MSPPQRHIETPVPGMELSRFVRLGAVVVSAALLLGPGAARAYIPPASFILRQLNKRVGSIRGVSAALAGALYGGGAADSGVPATWRLYLASPDRFRLETRSGRGTTVEVWNGGTRTVRAGEAASSSSVAAAPPLTAIFVTASARTALVGWGVDTGQVTLGRFRGHICWVIGSKAEDPTRPQVWIDKDTFLPVRLILFEGEGEARRPVEWALLDYDPTDRFDAFPRRLELRVAGQVVARMAVQRLRRRDVPPGSLFTSTAPEPR